MVLRGLLALVLEGRETMLLERLEVVVLPQWLEAMVLEQQPERLPSEPIPD
jgi:hypothetical protein